MSKVGVSDPWFLMRRDLYVGISAWTEPSLAAGTFYPPEATTSEARLRYYGTRYPLVEVDATFYAPVNETVVQHWVERTPDDFLFDVKAYRLLTHHPTPPSSLWRDVRDSLGAELIAKPQIYCDDVDRDVMEEVLRRFLATLQPLRAGFRMGLVLLQFPHYYYPSERTHQHLRWLRNGLGSTPAAIEFRQPRWVDADHLDDTLGLLRELDFTYVCVDEPQHVKGSMPPLAVATAETAMVRFHGRNAEMWSGRGAEAAERSAYDYPPPELEEWVPRIERLHRDGRPVHIVMNNGYRDFAVRAAETLARQLIEAPRAPLAGLEHIRHLRDRLASS